MSSLKDLFNRFIDDLVLCLLDENSLKVPIDDVNYYDIDHSKSHSELMKLK